MAHKHFFPARPLVIIACMIAVLVLLVYADIPQNIGRLLKQGEHTQALEQVDRGLSDKPQDAQGRFLKGLTLMEMNKPNDAIAVFTKLTKDYPKLPEPYNNLAVIYAQQKQYEKAKQALEMAIHTHPSYATALENLNDIYARQASQAYNKALQLDPSNATDQLKLSTINDLTRVNTRPGAARPASGKPSAIVAPAETKPVEPKPAEVKSVTPPKPAATKPAEVKPSEPKIVVATPAAKPTKLAEPSKPSAVAEVTKALDGWLAAWSKKDVNGYLAHYANNFQTPGGQLRTAWEAERTKRVGKPGTIRVSYEGLRITVDGDTATARFRQFYRSASLKSGINKTVVFVRHDRRWLIQQEKIGNR